MQMAGNVYAAARRGDLRAVQRQVIARAEFLRVMPHRVWRRTQQFGSADDVRGTSRLRSWPRT